MVQLNSSIANKNSISTGGNVLVAASNNVECLKTDRTVDFVLTEPIPSRGSNDNQNQTRYIQLILCFIVINAHSEFRVRQLLGIFNF